MLHAELTKEDGGRFGAPRDSALIIASVKKDPEHPKAQAIVRFSLGFGQHRAIFVRDSFKHVLSVFPAARGGSPWVHATDTNDQDVVFPAGSIAFYEQGAAEGTFDVIVELEGQPCPLQLKATLDEVRNMVRDGAATAEGGEADASATG